MAIAQGNLIDDADMTSKFSSQAFTVNANSTSAYTYASAVGSGYIFFCFSNAGNTYRGYGIAYESSGWHCSVFPSVQASSGSINFTVDSSGRLGAKNSTATKAHIFLIWVGAGSYIT